MKESLPIAGMVAVTAMVYWLLMILTYVFGERAAYMRLQPWLAGGIGIVCGIAARILIPQLIVGGRYYFGGYSRWDVWIFGIRDRMRIESFLFKRVQTRGERKQKKFRKIEFVEGNSIYLQGLGKRKIHILTEGKVQIQARGKDERRRWKNDGWKMV